MFRKFLGYVRSQSIAILALFFALGGTAGAAAAMWTGANIVDGTLTGADIQDKSLTGSDIANGSISSQDLAPGAVSGGGSIVLAQINDLNTLNIAPTTATDQPPVTLESDTFTTTTGKFVGFTGVVAVTSDANAGCQSGATIYPPTTGFTVYLDGNAVADAGTWEADHFVDGTHETVGPPHWVEAGTHTLTIEYRPRTCGDGNPGDPVPAPGQLYVSNLHAVAYSVSN